MSDGMKMYGGQAVLEGVMMRGEKVWTIAVRAPDDSIIVETKPLATFYRSGIMKLPFLRGLLGIWDALVLGMQALTFSAQIQVGEDEKIEGAPMAITMIFSLLIAIGLFFLLPAGVAYLAERWLGWSNWLVNITEGLIRLGLLVGYIWAIGFMPDIRRVFSYHGAEHKTINAYEAGTPLTVEGVRAHSRLHPRCGTAFLLTVVILSVLLFAALGPLPLLTRLISRILLLPLLAAISYEFIRLTGRLSERSWARVLIAPNLALQRLTTHEPEPEMIEVALEAFAALRAAEGTSVADKT
ncbi:MAG: DUF1385 domain-containing protein [Anaerolineales bacterium]|jgi:uncharacterized protein YqhQ